MKLAVIDKDGTLTKTKHGGPFPLNPQDQKLLPGVEQAIERLKAEGWTIAIASNQGGCDWFNVKVDTLKIGDLFQRRHKEDHLYGTIYTVEKIAVVFGDIDIKASTSETAWVDGAWKTTQIEIDFSFDRDTHVLIKYKTIEQAVGEVAYAADLCEITWGFFCPDMLGMTCIEVEKTTEYLWGCEPTDEAEWKHGIIKPLSKLRRKFRKPYPGMLQQAREAAELPSLDDCLMIGDRPEDEQAAHAAGFRFLWADAWRDGAEKCN
jgi:histidinol phosphatase-like enzyme